MTMASFSEIGSFIWSDHAPVFLELAIPRGVTTKWSWTLNDNLLKDEVCMLNIRQAVNVIDHAKDTTSLPLQWETLKCALRGLFIKHRARLKKERGDRISSLLKEISKLEKVHKQNSILEQIELQTLLNEQTLQLRDKSHVLFYQYGNKPSRLLARALF